jgi:hypothetical protein
MRAEHSLSQHTQVRLSTEMAAFSAHTPTHGAHTCQRACKLSRKIYRYPKPAVHVARLNLQVNALFLLESVLSRYGAHCHLLHNTSCSAHRHTCPPGAIGLRTEQNPELCWRRCE